MSNTAYIGIGSNLGSPVENCRNSITALRDYPRISLTARSPFYKTEPEGIAEQNWFINAVVKISTELEPEELLDSLLQIETAMGRVRKEKWGPRIIDLDILLYEDRIIKMEKLKIPHPEMAKRRFVLQPLSELAPDLVHPELGKTIEELLRELAEDRQVHRVSDTTE